MFWLKHKYKILLLVGLFLITPSVQAQEENPFTTIADLIQDIFVGIGQIVSMGGLEQDQQVFFLRAVVFFGIFTAFYMGGQFALRNVGDQANKYAGIFAFLIALTASIMMPSEFIRPLTGSLTLLIMSLMFLGVLGIPLYVMYIFIPSFTRNKFAIHSVQLVLSIVSIFVVSVFSTAVLEGDSGSISEGLFSFIATLPGLLLILFLVLAFVSGFKLLGALGVGSNNISNKKLESGSNKIRRTGAKMKNLLSRGAKAIGNKSKKGGRKIRKYGKKSLNTLKNLRRDEDNLIKDEEKIEELTNIILSYLVDFIDSPEKTTDNKKVMKAWSSLNKHCRDLLKQEEKIVEHLEKEEKSILEVLRALGKGSKDSSELGEVKMRLAQFEEELEEDEELGEALLQETKELTRKIGRLKSPLKNISQESDIHLAEESLDLLQEVRNEEKKIRQRIYVVAENLAISS